MSDNSILNRGAKGACTIPSPPLKTAVLFLVFNRLDTTKRVFEAIRQAKPSRLYIASDGPRDNRAGEEAIVQAVRDYIINHVDWNCEIKTLYREHNLGCKYAVSSAITWFFENEESGIIIEDDCLPSQSFFIYCQELLDCYRTDTRIMQICGFSFLKKWKRGGYSYYFSNYGPIWGWASWRRAWKCYDVNIKLWPEIKEKKLYEDISQNKAEAEYRRNLYDNLYAGKINTWDYQWGLAKLINRGLSIIPSVNMISNLGFAGDGTHTVSDSNDPYANMDIYDLELPLNHPKYVIQDRVADDKFVNEFMMIKPMKNQIKRIARQLMNKVNG
jgi:hypothetical protein